LSTDDDRRLRLLFVCAGSQEEGLGHIFRSVSLAHAAAKRHDVEMIACIPASLDHLLAEISVPVTPLADRSRLAATVAERRADIVIFDTLSVRGEVMAAARRAAPTLVSTSPIFDRMDEVDILFTRADPPADLPPEVAVYAGLDYAIFSEHCVPIPDAVYEANLAAGPLSVALGIGGGDSANDTGRALNLLLKVEQPCVVWVLVGDAFGHSLDDMLAKVRPSRHEVVFARTSRSLWRVAANCSLGIFSSGLSTLEAVYAGLPVISVHRRNDASRGFRTAYDSLCLDGGSFEDGSFAVVRDIVGRLHDDRDELRTIRRRLHGVIPGNGANAIVEVLERRLEVVS